MTGFSVLVTDYAWPDLEIERDLIEAAGGRMVVALAADVNTLSGLAADVDAIMTCWANVPAEVIDAASRLRIVARFGIGLDNIDVDHCTLRGIPVTNVPDYCQTEVAEHALGLILSLARNLSYYDRQMKQGNYRLDDGLPIYRVAGKTLGILGYGRIGAHLAGLAKAMGMRVITCSRRATIEPAEHCGSLLELLATSDFVSLHLPLTDETREVIGGEELARMKPSAFLINTARGELVDQQALETALEKGQIAGAGLDVHVPEPPDLNRPLYSHPRVIATPHSAFVSDYSVNELRRRATGQVLSCMQGQIPQNVINPQVL